ncbi:MAG TPA: 2TM domain-containing protein [Methyloceanibacter sp.]|nr:2TM domain-containing protein [Methyloceanibacter sp.]
MFKDLSMRVFLIHLAAFVAITAGLAAVNLWFAPQYPWFIWVLIGWGAAVATHAFALLMRQTRRRERIFIDRKARSFTVHLFAYVATVLILFFVNLTVTPNLWWFYWVALGWGAGVIAHGACAFRKQQPHAPQEAQPTKQAAKSRPRPAPKRSPGTPGSKSSKRSS